MSPVQSPTPAPHPRALSWPARYGRRGAVLALLAATFLLPPTAVADLRFDEGVARDPADGRLLYREQHWIRRDGESPIERLVLYRCADGTAFARKRVDYRASAVAPAFQLDDIRDGYREGLRRLPAPQVFARTGAGQPEQTAILAAAHLVADAGFDEFVQRQWPLLLAGDAVPLDFAVPARQASYRFSLRRVGAATVAGEPAWRFRLRLGGWLAWVAPAIDVAYSQRSRRLLRFDGLSNLRTDDGRRQMRVRIDFETPSRPASEDAWRQAEQTVLHACRTGQ